MQFAVDAVPLVVPPLEVVMLELELDDELLLLVELDVLLELELDDVLAASAGAAAEAAATSDTAPPTSIRRARLLKRSFMSVRTFRGVYWRPSYLTCVRPLALRPRLAPSLPLSVGLHAG